MATDPDEITAVIMAKAPESGQTKTRLVSATMGLDSSRIIQIASAMLECTISRLAGLWPTIVAATPDSAVDRILLLLDQLRDNSGVLAGWSDPRVHIIEQGPGNLGQRIDRVWRTLGRSSSVAFFGLDSPDVPIEVLQTIPDAMQSHDLAVGPTSDGGYWVLAARGYYPEVLNDIDWGGSSVYDQTCRRAAEAGLAVKPLPVWRDVDRPADLDTLRRRLAKICVEPDAGMALEPALLRLHDRLNALLGPLIPTTADLHE